MWENHKLFMDSPKEAEIIDLSTSIVWMENEIVMIEAKPDVEATLEDAERNFKSASERFNINEKNKALILCDIRQSRPLSKEIRDYYVTEEVVNQTKAFAFIIAAPLSKMIANLFIGIRKPPIPLKMFTDKFKAVKWLNQFKNITS